MLFAGSRIAFFRKMQRNPATIEEQLILKAIREECPWESLPKRLQSTLSSKEEWHRRLASYFILIRLNFFVDVYLLDLWVFFGAIDFVLR